MYRKDIRQYINSLSLQEQFLELLMLDIRYFSRGGQLQNSNYLADEVEELFKKYPVGGVILFRENLSNFESIRSLTKSLQKNIKYGRLIGIDQEGGIVNRIDGASKFSGNMALGAINDPCITTKVANIIADELCYLGINLNFAPVLDVNSNPKNPIVGVRAFGSDPKLVAIHGCATIEGYTQHGVLTCAKHYPGHGDTFLDSHLGETYVNRSLNDLETVNLYPFKMAIASQIDMLMTAHVIVPQLDNNLVFSEQKNTLVSTPATLSKPIITKLLREKMCFKGVIATDALDMQAISQYFNPVEATLLALEAGVDLITMPVHIWCEEDIDKFIDYINTVCQMCSSSPILTRRISESCERILILKYKILEQKNNYVYNESVNHIAILNKNREFEEQVASKCITLFRNTANTLPWQCHTQDQIVLIAQNNQLGVQVLTELEKLGYNKTKLFVINDNSQNSIISEILTTATRVLLLSHNLVSINNTLNFIVEYLNKHNIPYVMLSCCNPYDIMYVKDANTNILVFGATRFDQTNNQLLNFTLNINAAIRKIMTENDISQFNTHCPVDLVL